MTAPDPLAAAFETHRPHLTTVARRLLGPTGEADDAVQETWLRLARAGDDDIANLGGWLTTAVARVSLSMLRARRTRREEPMEREAGRASPVNDVGAASTGGMDPEATAVVTDSVGLALLVVLERLSPVERLAFVLHDLFGLPFDEIAPIVERSPTATRQLASRARRRVRDADRAEDAQDAQDTARPEVVTAFLAAARDGDFAGLLRVLDPDVVLRADDRAVAQTSAALEHGAPELAVEVRGADAVARVFCGRARAARLALVDSAVGAAYAVEGRVRTAFRVLIEGPVGDPDARIVGIEAVADPDALAALDVVLLDPLDR